MLPYVLELRMKNPANIFYPKDETVFWCQACDHELVDSTDESTGHFYIQFGHVFNPITKTYDGDYVGVMFAVCSKCEGN